MENTHEHAGAERGAVRSGCASLRPTAAIAARPGLGDEFLKGTSRNAIFRALSV